jgi:RNA polymerase sigma-70 factor (ECF subfamily)
MAEQLQHQASSSETADDAELVAAARVHPAAFAPLYRRYIRPIYGYCRHRLSSRELAEDATGRVFAHALAALPGFRGGSFRAWLFAIAHNEVAAVYRTRWEAPLEIAMGIHDPRPSPEEEAERSEARRQLKALLGQLPPSERRVVELRLAGLSGAEIAQALGRSRGAVDVAQSRAVSRLRALLAVGEEVDREA